MKIGILTFHRCINYGSYWQARCLAEGIQAMGHEVEILDHESAIVNLREWKCAYRPILPTHVHESDFPLYREKIERFFDVFETMPLSARFPLDNPAVLEDYDMVVVGSDEVWNLSHPWYGGCPLFYGDGIPATHLISYAASFGNYNAGWGLPAEWADKLRNFSSISVRDDNSKQIVQQALGIDPVMVLDPCLQFDIEPAARQTMYTQPYMAVYGHNFSPFYIEAIKHWAQQNHLPLVSIGYRNHWADENWLTADPHDFAHFVSGATAMATNFFHGCVFALRNQKPFVCESSAYRNNKVQGLMTAIGGEQHLVNEQATPAHYNAMLSNPVVSSIFTRIEALRHVSAAYLRNALAVPQTQRA